VNRRAPVVAAGVVVIVLVLLAFLVVLPKAHEVSRARQDLISAEQQRSALQAQLQALEEAKQQAPQTEKQIHRIQEKIPATADLPGLFRTLQDAADGAAVDFFSFSPGTPLADPTGTYSTLPSSIQVTGSYLSLEQFLGALETLPRAAKVTSIAITPGGSGSGPASTEVLQMSMTVEFFTTDTSAGPGSVPGPTQGVVGTGTTAPSPGVEPSPSASPPPSPSGA
jgi:Tfp pilus assembly protein PilO